MSKITNTLYVSKKSVGINNVYFDLFNAEGSNQTLNIASIQCVVSGEVAVTGVIGVDLYLTYTTSAGTNGNVASRSGTTLTGAGAITFGSLSPVSSALPAEITARRAPTTGVTAGNVIACMTAFTEETNAGTYIPKDFLSGKMDNLIVPQGYGIRVVQGTVASVGTIAWNVFFGLKQE